GVSDEDVDSVHREPVAGAHRRPHGAEPAPLVAESGEDLRPRHRNAFPHLARPKFAQDGDRSPDVIRVAVCERDGVEPPHAGGATRYASIGAACASSAERTRPSAPRCATYPTSAAPRADTSAAGTTAMPATCAMPISGIARKFNARPANVTRENASAPTGKSI